MRRSVPGPAPRVRRGAVRRSPQPPRRAPRVSLRVLAGGLAGTAALLLLLFELTTWDHVTPGVSALGTSLSGASRDDAVARLTPAVQHVLDRPLKVQTAEHTWTT